MDDQESAYRRGRMVAEMEALDKDLAGFKTEMRGRFSKLEEKVEAVMTRVNYGVGALLLVGMIPIIFAIVERLSR